MSEGEEKETKKQEGYFVADVPTAFGKVIAKDDKEVPLLELVCKMANALDKAGIEVQ